MSERQSQEEVIAGYLDRLVEFLGWCARYRRDKREPEVFLWNARRALETICLLVEECATDECAPRGSKRRKKKNDDNVGESLYGTLQRLNSRGLLQDAYPALDSIRQTSNLGVHVQGPGRPEYRTATPTCSHSLFEAVRWVIEFAPFASRLSATQVASLRAALQDLVRDEVPTPSEELLEAQERAESAEKTVHQLRARASDRPPPAEPTDEPLPALPSTRTWAWAGGLALMALAFATGYAVRGAGAANSAQPSRATADTCTGEMVCLDAGTDGGTSAGRSNDTNSTHRTPNVAPAYLSDGGEAGDEGAAVQEPAGIADDAPRWECPDGMQLMGGGSIRIGQPLGGRANWPRPRPAAIPEIQVQPFCMDEEAMTTGSLPDGTTRSSQCRWRGKPVAVCIDANVAEQVCAGRDARLPQIIEWEWAARHQDFHVHQGAEGEWVQDLYPPAIFNRRRGCSRQPCAERMFRQGIVGTGQTSASGVVLYSWNVTVQGRQEPDHFAGL